MANTNAVSPTMWQQSAHNTCWLSSHIILCLYGQNKLLAATTYPTYKITHLQTGRQTARRTNKMYPCTHASPTCKQSDRMYHRTYTSPTRKQADRQNVSLYSHITDVWSQIDKIYHHTHTPPTYEQADRQTKCILYSHIAHSWTSRQTKCITTLAHHPFRVGHTKCITILWTGRQTDKMYNHTRTSPSHRQTDRLTKCITVHTHHPLANSHTDRQNMYRRTHTGPATVWTTSMVVFQLVKLAACMLTPVQVPTAGRMDTPRTSPVWSKFTISRSRRPDS